MIKVSKKAPPMAPIRITRCVSQPVKYAAKPVSKKYSFGAFISLLLMFT
jgi:hypothetical protein